MFDFVSRLSKLAVKKYKSSGMASYIRLFCDLPLDNKLGSQVCKGKYQRTEDSTCIIGIDTYFTLTNSLYSLIIQMWFYYHKRINFIYPCIFEQVNLEL